MRFLEIRNGQKSSVFDIERRKPVKRVDITADWQSRNSVFYRVRVGGRYEIRNRDKILIVVIPSKKEV